MRGLAALLAVMASGAAADQCAPHTVLIEALRKGYGETVQTSAMSQSGRLVEVTANVITGSWSVLITAPGQLTCLVDAGGAFELVLEPQGVKS